MPHISRNPLSPDAERDLINTLEVVLAKITKQEDIDAFLLALLSSTERLMLAKRLAMIILIHQGVPESQIAEMLHVTRNTVAKMQLFFEARGKGYEVGLRALENEKLMSDVKKILLRLAAYSARAAGGRV